jgi:hypothetical protein
MRGGEMTDRERAFEVHAELAVDVKFGEIN